MLKILILTLLALANGSKPVLDSDPLFDFRASSIHALLRSKKWTCVDIVSYFLERSALYDDQFKTIISYNPEAIKRATQLDLQFKNDPSKIGKLHCVPFVVKDNIDIRRLPTTAGVKPFRNQVPEKNALVIDRLLDEGAVVIAKANMAQLAIGALYQSDQVGLCLNPFDKRRTCSGSSSGSGASISAGFGVVSLGTDTGGSILGPSAFNGLFGLRPPVNSNLTNGVLPVNLRKDTVGPMAKHLEDLVLAYSVLTSDPSLLEAIEKPIDPKNLKVLLINDFFESFKHGRIDFAIGSDVKPLLDESVVKMKNLGVEIVEKNLSSTELDQLSDLLKSIDDSTLQCTVACLPKSYQDYWSDADRFGTDLPYKRFVDLIQSSYLDNYWTSAFQNSGLDLNMDLGALCSGGCQVFDSLNLRFKEFYAQLVSEDIDALFLPTIASKVKLHAEAQVAAKDDNFGGIAFGSDSAFLSMPSGFTPKNADELDGLPFGMGLIIRQNKMLNGFRIARLYEAKQSFAKLPSSVPLLSRNQNSVLTNFFNSRYSVDLIIGICIFINKYWYKIFSMKFNNAVIQHFTFFNKIP
ncbi:amidase [Brachionus plicatilis]|uniref:Amidase n=1 Tax=Brachionus plicatilis TaxID=10195 RepID=A0A3M7T0C5_BRAPC|nr:amidase [Brachionus plicatilis]